MLSPFVMEQNFLGIWFWIKQTSVKWLIIHVRFLFMSNSSLLDYVCDHASTRNNLFCYCKAVYIQSHLTLPRVSPNGIGAMQCGSVVEVCPFTCYDFRFPSFLLRSLLSFPFFCACLLRLSEFQKSCCVEKPLWAHVDKIMRLVCTSPEESLTTHKLDKVPSQNHMVVGVATKLICKYMWAIFQF